MSETIERSCVRVEFDEGIAWVILNRPDKRNAMSPALNSEMVEILDELELDERAEVIVLTGAGDSFSAGMDLKEYFRETEGLRPAEVRRIRQTAYNWQWRKLMFYEKPTIAMVNGWCFGGAFTPLVACDLSIAADEATFGLSEINWGIIPGGNVTKAVADRMRPTDALMYIMTGRTFDGPEAVRIGLVNESVPLAQLKDHVRALARELLGKNLTVLNGAKTAFKMVRSMTWDASSEYLTTKAAQVRQTDASNGKTKGMSQFLDDKSYRPGLETYRKDG
ncbi:MAG: p-hydroxycinnamoyl CoA hydratase/lyase [Blastomonas sp.]